jgi:hypothetical protein
MFDATQFDSNGFNTSLGNPLNLSSAIAGQPLTGEADPLLASTAQNELALSSSLNVDVHLNPNLEAAAISDTSGSVSPELFLFAHSESPLPLASSTINAGVDQPTTQVSSDSLTGINEHNLLVGSLNQNLTTQRDVTSTSVIQRTLRSTDPITFDSRRFRNDYLLTGISAGEQVQVNLNADFDTALVLINANNGKVLGFNNNSNGTLNSQLTFTAEAGVDYLIRTTSFTPNATGEYTLTTNVGTAVPGTPIIGNQTVSGTLASTDPRNPTRYGRFSDDYLLTGVVVGQAVQVNLNADFDTYLQVVNANTGAVIAYNDDSGSATNSQLSFVVESDVNYIIRATSFAPRVTGDYTLTTNTVTLPEGYNTKYGYGLVDAAAAVAGAVGESSPFPEVAELGGNNWGLDGVNAPEAWAQGYTGQGVVVAVVDSGVDYNHSDLSGNIWVNSGEIADNGVDDDGNGFVDDVRGWDFFDGDNDPMDSDVHGTHIAGTIAAENNGFGVTGVAYNATIMPVRVIDSEGGTSSDIAAGIRYAADNGANVINLSLGGNFTSAEEEEAIRYASDSGVVVVMAAGNEGASQPVYPARYATDWGIAVGAVDSNKTLANFSNRAGATVLDYVVAPGVDILSTTPGNSYQSFDGTSMAAPHVAGVAALVLSANPNLTPAEVESLLTQTANRTGITV